jgi:hypothetical protein
MAVTIYSGGQTGVDRGALDAALDHGCCCGGWCPAGRLAEDGPLPAKYPLVPLQGGYLERTLQNVLDTEGTFIIYFSELEGGTAQTWQACRRYRKPYRLVDGDKVPVAAATVQLREFVVAKGIRRLNIAGPRQSRKPQAYQYAYQVVSRFLTGEKETLSGEVF